MTFRFIFCHNLSRVSRPNIKYTVYGITYLCTTDESLGCQVINRLSPIDDPVLQFIIQKLENDHTAQCPVVLIYKPTTGRWTDETSVRIGISNYICLGTGGSDGYSDYRSCHRGQRGDQGCFCPERAGCDRLLHSIRRCCGNGQGQDGNHEKCQKRRAVGRQPGCQQGQVQKGHFR